MPTTVEVHGRGIVADACLRSQGTHMGLPISPATADYGAIIEFAPEAIVVYTPDRETQNRSK